MKNTEANNAFTKIIIINLIISVAITILCLSFSDQIASLLGVAADNIKFTVEYFSVILYFILFFNIQNTLLSIVRNDGDSKLVLNATIAGI